MSDKLEKILQQLTNVVSQKDIFSIEVSGKCDVQGVLEIVVKNKPELKNNVSYKISLVSLDTISFFPNLTEKNNKFYYRNRTDREDKIITLDTGGYNIKDYNETMKMVMKTNGDNPDNISISLMPSGKTAITLSDGYKVYFDRGNTWRHVLGFNRDDLITDGMHVSAKIADVVPVQKVYVKCNLCTGSIFNGEASNIIFSFPNNKRYGALMNFNPNPLIPLKLQTTNVDRVRLEFRDEDNEPVDFLGSNVCCQLLIEQF